MKRIAYFLIFSLTVGLLLVSCKKDTDNLDSRSYTSFKVYVVDSVGNYQPGVSVSLFDSPENRDAQVNALYDAITYSEGYAYFTELDSKTYYILAKRNVEGVGVQLGKTDTVIPIKSLTETAVTVVLK